MNTIEEAIKQLKLELSKWESDCKSYHKTKDALAMVIKALEKEYCEDAVSRKDVFDMIEQIQDAGGFIGYNTYSEAFDRVGNMSPVRPVSCIATVTFNKEDMQKIVDEKVKELVLESAK